jgi:site-specific DNA-methyltransferase (adenine-specific)
MSPYIDLRNCGWEELLPTLPDKSIDLLLTDPPYSMDWQSGIKKDPGKKILNDDNLDWLPGWVAALPRVMKPDSHMYIWCSWHKVDIFKQQLERHFKIKNMLVWYKAGGGMGDLYGGYGGCHELCFFINNGKDLIGKRDTDVIDGAYRTGNVYHVTQKPVNLAQYFIRRSSKEGDKVLDCFAGSASAGVACHKERRYFVGSEIDKDFYEAALKHIKNETIQVGMEFPE